MSEETDVMSTSDRLVYMAHQIARNLAAMGEERAVISLSDHLSRFWDPRMKAQIIAISKEQPEKLSLIVAAAVKRMATHRSADAVKP
jgi:formate dehydrogenase subunit delta